MLFLLLEAKLAWRVGDVSIRITAWGCLHSQALCTDRARAGIFIIEGTITVCFCILGRFLIIDFPAQAKRFLKAEERDFVIARLNLDRGDAEEDEVTFSKILFHLRDWRLYIWTFNMIPTSFPQSSERAWALASRNHNSSALRHMF
jgi:hypothetical protein